MDTLLQSLSAQGGLLGTLLALAILLVGILGRLLLAEKDKRIADAIKNRDDLVLPIERLGSAMQEVVNTVKQKNSRNDI